MLQITERARGKMEEMLQKGSPQAMIRIYLKGMGWGGPRIGLTLEESAGKEDVVEKLDHITLVLEPGVKNLLSTAQLDYRKGLFGGFKIMGPSPSCC